MRSFRR